MTIPHRMTDATLIEYLPTAGERAVVSLMFATERMASEMGADSIEAHNAHMREHLLELWADDLETRPQQCAALTRRGTRCTHRAASWRVDRCRMHTSGVSQT